MIKSSIIRGTVLFADDEPMMHDIVSRGLAKIGCDVECALDGLQAMDKFNASPGEFCVVIIDLNMPGMSGIDMVKLIKAVRPYTHVIVASGHICGATKKELTSIDQISYLEKPYEIMDLCDLVDSAIEKKG